MKFELGFVLLASALGGALADLLPELVIADMQGLNAPKGDVSAQACPPDFPRKCPINNLCCQASGALVGPHRRPGELSMRSLKMSEKL
ncbi:hypothetical protein VFPBJ_02366 [Purpureocillium lilacinum]|uniref:Uncharacterized protein n=1 Tax=Purpureocillium lilacinum TaxID=33203 RepID=A0A179H1N2_PURLI|nr:hypothetical protein VFPBJ_02366 [Purpureocillium lilacinum]